MFGLRMRYRVAPSDGDRLVLAFSMPERPFVILFLALASVVCLVLGLSYTLAGPEKDSALRAMAFLGFSLFCFCAIFLFSSGLDYPARLVFENGTGWLRIHDRKGHLTGAVPYDGIAGFSVRPTLYDRVVRHSAGMDLVRGGRWELYASQNETKVRVFQEALSKKIRLQAPPVGPSPADSAPADGHRAIDRHESGARRYTWRRQIGAVPLAVSIITVLSFAVAVVGTKPFATGPGAYAVAAAFGGLFLFAAFVSVMRTIGEKTDVRIERSWIECRRTSALVREKSFSLPLSQIAAVDLSMSFSRIGMRIVFLRPNEVEQFTRYRQGTFRPAETIGLALFLRHLPQLDVSALPIGERLALAELIREAVQQGAAPK